MVLGSKQLCEQTIKYAPKDEEAARQAWYLASRDDFVYRLVRASSAHRTGKLRRLLDSGCGTGGLLCGFKEAGTLAVGTDRSLASLRWGRSKDRIRCAVLSDLTALPFKDDAFDVAVCSEVLEHLDNDERAVQELVRVARRELLITVPAHGYLWSDSDRVLLHFRRYSRKRLKKLLRRAGTTIERLKPYGLMPGVFLLVYLWLGRRIAWKSALHSRNLPLASRFRPPGWLDSLLRRLFVIDLYLSMLGLVPWGHGWYVVLRKDLPPEWEGMQTSCEPREK